MNLLVLAGHAYSAEGKFEISGPTTIREPGSYILTNNIESTASDTVIRIESDNVKLDLNGFTISQLFSGSGDGITILPHRNIEISNGTIRGFFRHGIFLMGSSGGNIRLHNLRVTENGDTGINLDFARNFIIEHCLITKNRVGISAGGPGLVINNVVGQNQGGGGLIGTLFGIHAFGYESNVFFNNTPDVISGVNLGGNLCSGLPCPP